MGKKTDPIDHGVPVTTMFEFENTQVEVIILDTHGEVVAAD